uniref:WD_REPEATS_REGION domain-containing protein n=1 Tax=Steinernema glaseri TaxID=37863 RepID=A0A1I7Y509_9BILA
MGRFLFKRKPHTKEASQKSVKRKAFHEEEVSSDDELSGGEDRHQEYSDGEEYEDVQSKAHREAKQLLKTLEADAIDEETGEIDNEAIAHRLQEDALAKCHKLHRQIADNAEFDEDNCDTFSTHRFSVISAVFLPDNANCFVSCGKDGSIVKYDTENQKTLGRIQYYPKNADNHKGGVTALAVSFDGRWLVSGGFDHVVKVWDLKTLRLVHNFLGHRGPITSLVFRKGSSFELFSGSKDRAVKAWNLDQFGYVDTSYGHQDSVSQIDMLARERILSVGSHDKTARFWKIDTESQLIFNGPKHSVSIDSCSLINEDHFVTGSSDGSISVWSVFKKKPIATVPCAHGKTDGVPNWIVSVAAVRYSDLFASGSSDGYIRYWKISPDYKSITEMGRISLPGFINAMQFSEDGERLLAAVGQEHKSGRWWKLDSARNCVFVVPVDYSN